MTINHKTTVADFLRIASIPALSVEIDKDVIKRLPVPKTYCGVEVKIEALTLGQLTDIEAEVKRGNALTAPVKVLFGLSDKQILRSRLFDLLAVVNLANEAIEVVNKAFERIKANHTSEEIQAGVKRLNFGTFGLVDSYARRMGIADHDYVLNNVPALLIARCMEIDHKTAEYQRRLNEIYAKKHKRE